MLLKTRVYNKADIGSDHDLVIMSFKQKYMDKLKNEFTQTEYKESIENKLSEEIK